MIMTDKRNEQTQAVIVLPKLRAEIKEENEKERIHTLGKSENSVSELYMNIKCTFILYRTQIH